jgi:hypothetical protein
MPEVFSVITQIKPPRRGFSGQVCYGCFTFIDGVVTLTDHDGNPVRDGDGRLYTRKLDTADHNDALNAAGALTKEFRLALKGKTKESERFSQPLEYRRDGSIV